jgi:HTH-type transcriptional regulator / antitoxin HigA
MTSGTSFNPAWASPPGETITELLEERSLSANEFATAIGYSVADVENLIEGRTAINDDLAERLASTLGSTSSFWLNRDAQYRSDVARLENLENEQALRSWTRRLPTSEMSKWGWIDKGPDKRAACLDFFDIQGLAEWNVVYGGLSELVAFRKSQKQTTSPEAVIAWLRQGEIAAEAIHCETFDRNKLLAIVPSVRALSRTASPEEFLPPLTALCASAGVAIAIVRAPTGCGVSGAARFLSADKALIQLSFRYRSDDHFWFTVFHEIGHLVLHARDGVFLEGLGLIDTDEEDEANRFSADVLIPEAEGTSLHALGSDFRKVMRFAKRIGIAPGIVVGQMQHRGLIPRNYLNKLKVRYEWRDA